MTPHPTFHLDRPIRPPTALVIEDDPMIALDLVSIVEACGFRVIGPCASADAALEASDEDQPLLVVTDLRIIGKRDGLDVAAELVRRFNVAVILITGSDSDATRARAEAIGVHAVVAKPYMPLQVIDAVHAALPEHLHPVPTH